MDPHMDTTPESVPETKSEKKSRPAGSNIDLSGDKMHGGGNIEKIREILFGAQARDYEKRFSRLEDRLLKEISGLKDDTRKRLDSLESFVKQELESLDGRLASEKNERVEEGKKLAGQIEAKDESTKKKLAQMEDRFNRSIRELRQQLLEQSQKLSDEILQKFEEVSLNLEQASSELNNDKVDRLALGDLFAELGLRLSNAFPSPLDIDAENVSDE